jgi:Radial spokehead-like protein
MATKTVTTAAVDDHHGGAHPAGNQIKQFDSLRNTLKNAKHSSGHDLYQHLVDVMNHIVTHCPDNGIDKFEEISYLLKLQRDGKIKSLSDFLLIAESRAYSTPGKALHDDTEKYLAKAKKMLDVSYQSKCLSSVNNK